MFREVGLQHPVKKRRINRVLLAQIGVLAAVPVILLSFPSPPAGLSGAPGEGTCASCHNGTASASGSVSVTFPGGLSYTPGTPQQLTVTVSETGQSRWGFELSARDSSNAQAGSFIAGANSQLLTSGTLQYVAETGAGTQAGTSNSASWTFTWTPPATNAGNITIYVAGLAANNDGGTSGDDTFTANYSLTPAAGGGGNTLTVNPATLTFNSAGGATPPSQSFQVTSSGSPLNFTTSVSTTSGGHWLTAVPPGGTTPLGVTVSVNPAGLATGTYTGTVTVTATGASNSPQSVGITFHVTSGTTSPALSLSPAALTFNSTNGGPVPPQTVQVSSTSSPLSFNDTVSTTSGGNWLSANPSSGTTPMMVSVSADPSGLSPGTYTGAVTFTSSGASNSPQTLQVTLMVGSSTPPPTNPGPLSFFFNVVDRQMTGTDRLLLSGHGSVDSSGRLTGSGSFTQYGTGGDDSERSTVATGTWTATGLTTFSPASSGGGGDDDSSSASGGVLEITVQISPAGGAPQTGTMKIAATGSNSGVTLAINGGSTFVPTGIGRVSIRASGGRGTSTEGGSDQ